MAILNHAFCRSCCHAWHAWVCSANFIGPPQVQPAEPWAGPHGDCATGGSAGAQGQLLHPGARMPPNPSNHHSLQVMSFWSRSKLLDHA